MNFILTINCDALPASKANPSAKSGPSLAQLLRCAADGLEKRDIKINASGTLFWRCEQAGAYLVTK